MDDQKLVLSICQLSGNKFDQNNGSGCNITFQWTLENEEQMLSARKYPITETCSTVFSV